MHCHFYFHLKHHLLGWYLHQGLQILHGVCFSQKPSSHFSKICTKVKRNCGLGLWKRRVRT
ncbi:hypothetical protein CUMW_195020, partial [Citrus unshiu]